MLLPQPLLQQVVAFPRVIFYTSPARRNQFAIANSILSENRSASTIASMIWYLTGVDLVQILQMPIIEYTCYVDPDPLSLP